MRAGPISRWVATSHKRAVSAVARTVPAALNASPFAPPATMMGEPIGWLSEPVQHDGLTAGDQEPAVIGVEGHRFDRAARGQDGMHGLGEDLQHALAGRGGRCLVIGRRGQQCGGDGVLGVLFLAQRSRLSRIGEGALGVGISGRLSCQKAADYRSRFPPLRATYQRQ